MSQSPWMPRSLRRTQDAGALWLLRKPSGAGVLCSPRGSCRPPTPGRCQYPEATPRPCSTEQGPTTTLGASLHARLLCTPLARACASGKGCWAEVGRWEPWEAGALIPFSRPRDAITSYILQFSGGSTSPTTMTRMTCPDASADCHPTPSSLWGQRPPGTHTRKGPGPQPQLGLWGG